MPRRALALPGTSSPEWLRYGIGAQSISVTMRLTVAVT